MKEEFENLYNDLENDNSSKLFQVWEKTKKDRKRIIFIATALCVIIDLIIIYKFCIESQNLGAAVIPLIIGPDVIIFLVSLLVIALKDQKYNMAYKECIINALIKNFFNDVDYIPKKKMPQEIYNKVNYNEYYNRYYSDDYVEAKIEEKYDMKMAEVHTVYETTHTDSDGNTTTDRTTKFYGLFIKIKINKSIKNKLFIRTDGEISKRDRLEMDSSEFERYFDVSSEDKIIGMQILTHDVMDLLINFRKFIKVPFDICVLENLIYIRLHIGSVFEAKISKKSIIDKEQTEKYYNILNFIETLSKKIINILNDVEI